MTLPEPAVALHAISSRDRRFDGRFWFGVTSTGIYCRPTCPARRPRDENVRFFASPSAAVTAGFRACRRCRPAAPTAVTGADEELATRALGHIAGGLVDEVGVSGLAATLAVSERHLHRTLIDRFGVGAATLAASRRAQAARALLVGSDLPISEIAYAAGFASLRTFNDAMRAEFGVAPRELRSADQIGAGAGEITLRLRATGAYDSNQVQRFLTGRCVPGLESIGEDLRLTKAVALPHGTALVRIRLPHDDEAAHLTVVGGSVADLGEVVARVRRWLDLDVDPGQVARVLRRDDFLAPMIASRRGLRVPTTIDPWETLVRTVVGQQVSVSAARTLLGRLVEALGTPVAEGLSAFPGPDVIAGAGEIRIGLPGARVATLVRLAELVATKDLDLAGPIEEVQHRLLSVKGVGPWTVSYFSMRGLGDPDSFPVGDLGIRQATAHLGLTTAGLEARSQRWRPWRTYATQLIWEGMA